MPQFERRLYDPDEDDRALDGDDDRLDDEGSRLPLLIVIALVVLVSFGGVVWLAYTQGVERGRSDATPQVVAEQQKRVTAPAKNPYSDLTIYRQQKPGAAADTSAAPSATESTDQSAETAPKATAPKRVASTPPPAPKHLAPRVLTTPAAKPKEQVAAAQVSVKPKPAAQSVSAERKATTAIPSPEESHAAGTPRQIAPAITRSQSAAAGAKAAAPAPSEATPEATKVAGEEKAAAASSGSYLLQIGSYKSEADANASWQSYKHAHASAGAYSSDIKAADLGAKGTWYRLRIGPFASLAEAHAACARLKAQGANCFPAKR